MRWTEGGEGRISNWSLQIVFPTDVHCTYTFPLSPSSPSSSPSSRNPSTVSRWPLAIASLFLYRLLAKAKSLTHSGSLNRRDSVFVSLSPPSSPHVWPAFCSSSASSLRQAGSTPHLPNTTVVTDYLDRATCPRLPPSRCHPPGPVIRHTILPAGMTERLERAASFPKSTSSAPFPRRDRSHDRPITLTCPLTASTTWSPIPNLRSDSGNLRGTQKTSNYH